MGDQKKSHVVIIGAGVGGLAAAGLWSKAGHKVTLLESHYAVGGCAGYFRRPEGSYDVGATTLSGMIGNRPLAKLSKDLGLNLEDELIPCDPGITLWDQEFIHLRKGIDEIAQEFSQLGVDLDEIKEELKRWSEIEKGLWSFLEHTGSFPYLDPLKALKVGLENLDLLKNPAIFTKTFYEFLPQKFKENPKFVKFINGLLLVSTQQTSHTCPAFMGIMGIMYPRDTWLHPQGMMGFCQKLVEAIEKFGGEIRLREKCLKVDYKKDQIVVHTNKDVYQCDKVIFNIHPELVKEMVDHCSLNTIYAKKLKQKGELWGAMTAYLKIPNPVKLPYQYLQCHIDAQKNRLEIGTLFYSFSNDSKRVTVSSHINLNGDFDSIRENKDKYLCLKQEYAQLVRETLAMVCDELNLEDIWLESVGTPKTFRRYTGRARGEVGGLIHNSTLSLLRLIPNKVVKDKFYHVGDFSFPGQGIVSVIQSAYNTLE